MIDGLENSEDYRGFEAAIIADYDAETAVERELASLLWRLLRIIASEVRSWRDTVPFINSRVVRGDDVPRGEVTHALEAASSSGEPLS